MVERIIKSDRLNESYRRIEHDSGVTFVLYPLKQFNSVYAMFATRYGSIDTTFKTDTDDGFVTVPEGIAHFLEHKLFESEDGDAFSRYAKTGAIANAFTSFDRTCYLFSCTDNFKESLEILFDFVTKPYFTPETVQKEQGIIGQEIKMYADNPEWCVLFNLLTAMYHENPVRLDIAGTVESIAKIDADLLYRCYNTFYNLNNMVVAIAGNFEVEDVLTIADRIFKKAEPVDITTKIPDEPEAVKQKKIEKRLPVSIPIFNIGYKHKPKSTRENQLGMMLDDMIVDILAGESSGLYRRLYDEALINQTFSTELFVGRGYVATIFSGESKDPDRVYKELMDEIARLKKEGIDPQAFERSKKATYGKYIRMLNRVDSVAALMLETYFGEVEAFELFDRIADTTLEQANKRLHTAFDNEKSSLSVILPQK